MATLFLLIWSTPVVAQEPGVPDQAADSLPADDVASTEPAPEAPALTARGRYNAGLDHLENGDSQAAADAFLAARDDAGPDPELRYRAAFNLALALATGVGPDAPPEEALETLRSSAAWFNDAVRLAPPDDDDARINLELVSQRILELADQLNEGNRLEARLDRLIDDQRGLRDAVRRLLAEVEAEGAGTEPIGFKNDFDALASRERRLMAEVGEGIDLAVEERLYIEQLAEEQRTPEQRSRAYQLAGVTDYLERARQSLSDARRLLRRLAGERAHRRADAGLREMKRAREQLLDPVAVLKAVVRDEVALIDHTRALAAFGAGVRLDATRPPWLTPAHLADRQEDAAVRTGGVLGRFEAVAASEPAAAGDGGGARMLRAVAAATPILADGLAAMRAAIAALEAGEAGVAVPDQERALRALGDAIEQFAGVRDLIELAYAGQQGVIGLLTPAEDSPVATLSTTERANAIAEIADANTSRLSRLEGLLEEEAEAALAQRDDASETDASETDASQGDVEDAQKAREAAAQRYALAEELRAKAQEGLSDLAGEVARLAEGAGDVENARAGARTTLDALAELRRLFFTIVEHLRELHAEQTETHDTTATLQFEGSADAPEDLPGDLGYTAERQSTHAALADALAAALAEQADAAAAASAAETPPANAADAGGDPTARLAEAAGEVRQAGGRMQSAAAALADAVGRAANMTPELEPALDDQTAAIEHLENALRTLSPPNQDQSDEGADGQQQQAQAQPQQSEEEEMSQRQALRRLQAIRDREAERQRRRQEDDAVSQPVEKDW
ncbi:MAG: hypothetical protein OXG82_15490 [Gammaproteobacteria bacterium]|nr:hypothetical protein [Gammaproteobacteria bacterium]